MKKVFLVILLLCCWQLTSYAQKCGDCGKLVIAAGLEYSDPNPDVEAIKVCANEDIDDLSNYVIMAETSSISPGEIVGAPDNGSYIFPAQSLAAGECFWIATETDLFTAYLGFAPDAVDVKEANVSGNAPIFLYCLGNLEDAYGDVTDPGTILSADPANYDKSWFHTTNNRCPNYGAWDLADFTVGPEDETKDTDNIGETSFPSSYSAAGSCVNCLGDALVCEMVSTCVPDNQFLMYVSYEGVPAGTSVEIFQGSATLGSTTAEGSGTIEVTDIGSSEIIGVRFTNGTCTLDRMTRGVDATGCSSSVCVWGGQKGPRCENGNLIVRLDPFGAGIGASGYTLEPSPETGGTIDGGAVSTASYGAITEFTVTGHTPGSGGVAVFILKDIDNGCELEVPVLDACAGTPPMASCTDGIMNQDETGIDCGGATCPACTDPTCDDGIMNQDETGIDCGGATCPACPTPTCDDGVMNQDETGIDCGGATCPACELASCTDGIQNQDEEGIDCGGVCGTACPEAIPTMSQWMLILMSLLLMTFGTLLIGSGRTKFAGVGTQNFSFSAFKNINNYPFNKANFMKAVGLTLFLALMASVGTIWVYGTIAMTDVIGTMVAGPVFAYLIHLLKEN